MTLYELFANAPRTTFAGVCVANAHNSRRSRLLTQTFAFPVGKRKLGR
nr:MAG TPA: hypothetical protein [Caudoviricetes sp.]